MTLLRSVPSFLLCLAACGGSDSTGPDSSITSVTVFPSDVSIVAGQTRQLFASDQTGTVIPASQVTWATSPSAVATVSAAGVLTGVADGSATITATAQGKSGTAAVTVVSFTFASVAVGGAHTC